MSYVLVKNKTLILLSSQHQTASVSSSEKKPTVILDNNATKGAVDSADKMLKKFLCHRISKMWLFVFLARLINICTLNAYILFKKRYAESSMTRLGFHKELSVALLIPAMQAVKATPPRIGIDSSVQDAMQVVLSNLLPQPLSASSLGQVTNTNTFKQKQILFLSGIKRS